MNLRIDVMMSIRQDPENPVQILTEKGWDRVFAIEALSVCHREGLVFWSDKYQLTAKGAQELQSAPYSSLIGELGTTINRATELLDRVPHSLRCQKWHKAVESVFEARQLVRAICRNSGVRCA